MSIEYISVSIGKYLSDITPPVPLSKACEQFFSHVIKTKSLFFFLLNLVKTADKLDEAVEKFGDILDTPKTSSIDSIDNIIKRKLRHLDSLYFHEEFFSQLIYCSSIDAYVIYLQDVLFDIA